MTIEGRDKAALDATVVALRDACGESVRAIVLVGEAASSDYRPRRSPLSLVLVLDEITRASLARVRDGLKRRWRSRVGTPLVFDPLYIESSVDVFPLEFLDMADRHILLVGDDPFADIEVDSLHLRIAVEEQARGKMLHLWEGYLIAGKSKRALRELLVATPPGFEVVLRGMLRLHAGAEPSLAPVRRPGVRARRRPQHRVRSGR